MNMRRPYQVTGLVFLAFAGYAFLESQGFRYFTSIGPGPGFFPYWLSLLLGGLGALMVVQASLTEPEPAPPDLVPGPGGVFRIGAVIAVLIATILLLEPLGFRLTMLGLFLFVLIVVGRHKLPIAVVIALLGSFGGHHLFVRWLNIPLPRGWFGF